MRTIASTVGTREEAELATRRLQAIGVTSDRIQLKEVAEPQAGVFISVKVSPDQVSAATDILKGGGTVPAEPVARTSVESLRQTEAVHTPPPSAPIRTTTTTRATSAAPARDTQSSHREPRQASASSAGKPLGRLIFMALALAAFGFALGAILGTFT